MDPKPTKRLRIFLRDFRLVEAAVHLVDGQALTSCFGSRRNYMNLRGARWAGTTEQVEHAVLRLGQVLWASAPDGDIPLTSASLATPGRDIEAQLDGGLLVRGRFLMSEHQRMSDYLETSGQFVPLLGAQLLRSGRPPKTVNVTLGDIVLNQEAVQAVWEMVGQHDAGTGPAAAAAEPVVMTGRSDNDDADDASTGYVEPDPGDDLEEPGAG
jgi:hypothetical protein